MIVAVMMGAGVAVTGPSGGHAEAQTPPTTTLPAGPPTSTIPLATTPPTTVPPTTVPAETSGRQWLVPVPTGCAEPELPDVVFVGTVREIGTPAGQPDAAQFDTARFQVDQARAGSVEQYAYDGIVDVRYGIDAKYLETGQQYLVGASVDPAAGVLASKVREPEPAFGGDEVIGAAESDVSCPVLSDPVRTLQIDGTPVEAGVISPLTEAKGSILRSLLLPLTIVFAVIFGLTMLRWILTGVGRGVGSVVRVANEPREVRAATRTRPRAR